MNKMQIAHDYAVKMLEHGNMTPEEVVETSWFIADAMQAEADKRHKAEAEQKRKEVREILNDANTFIEREGKHFDDVEEWQPDWSQAPAGYNWFCVGSNGGYGFFSNQAPELFKDYYFVGADGFVVNNHGYQGSWKDSLRKRPEALQPEVDWRVAPSWANWWAIRQDSSDALWCVNKPTVTEDCFLSHGGCGVAPSFGFIGSHIVERPE